MIRKTFDTLRDNPIIFLGFAVPFIILILAMLPMISTMNNMTGLISQIAMTGQEPSTEMIMQYAGGYFSAIGLSFLASLLITFLVLPAVFQKVYEACADNLQPNWIKRGLKRSWWKIFVVSLIISAAASVISIVVVFIMIIPILGQLIFIAIMLAIMIFTVVALTAVIAEDDFGTALGSTFKVGKKYFFKQLGTIALTWIPAIIITMIMVLVFTLAFAPYANALSQETMVEDMFSNMFGSIWIFMIVFYIYYIFAFAFIYTYSMHQYLENKQPTFSEPIAEPSMYGFDAYNSQYKNSYDPPEKKITKSGTKTTSGNLNDY